MEARTRLAPGVVRGAWWHATADGRVQCDLCPRACRLRDGQRAFCFVREARDGAVVLTSYGRTTGLAVDPVEKKPLYHFYPGTTALSFGTAGCNLGCRYCQNWDISKARDDHGLSHAAAPEDVAAIAAQAGCRAVAFTYNDPIVFAEYAIDCAAAAHARGLATVAVTSGYMGAGARRDFYRHMDAANVDLKAFTEGFYHDLCAGHLAPVLETLEYIHRETATWLEVTTLLIPGRNDSEAEVARLCEWFVAHLGPEVPLHFTAFFPAYRLLDVPPTPLATLARARRQALAAGLRHVYTGNVRDPAGSVTACAACGQRLIAREGRAITAWALDDAGRCRSCGAPLAGRFEPRRARDAGVPRARP